MTDQPTPRPIQVQAVQGGISTAAIVGAITPLTPPKVPNAISYEHGLAQQSALAAQYAIHAAILGLHETKTCNTILAGGRILQGAARLSQDLRLGADKLSVQESTDITQSIADKMAFQQPATH